MCIRDRHDIVAGRGHVAADDDRFGIERVDEEGDGLADLFARFFDQFDRKVVVVLRRGDDVIDMDALLLVVLLLEDRVHASFDQVAHLVLDGDARNLGFETAFFAARADDFVVEERDMAELACEAAFAVVQLSVHDDADEMCIRDRPVPMERDSKRSSKTFL